MRFDMRAPEFGASAGALYAAALDMVGFAESRGALAATVCEHHTMADGYLPSPLVLATAMAARTTNLSIMTTALILPLYNPIRLAEDMVVLDIISGGRVSYVLAIGYRSEEYEHHGADFGRRGRLVEDQLSLLLRAKAGNPFEYQGRSIHVTPAPVTPGGPKVIWGGGSPAAARRAGRFGLDFIAQGGGPDLEGIYADECRSHGREPGFCLVPPTDMATTVFVANDLEAAWAELGPHLLHDVRSYAAINEGNTHTASISTASTVEELRSESRTHRIISVDEAVTMIQSGVPLPLQPLVGGLPPEVAWRYLRTVTGEVLSRL
jgi:alkanesulfonate monooxygenase SsuD/methylene tetrahydromethanopterin reductase-like flavin-dependent oxidoreductase (luciferase family)